MCSREHMPKRKKNTPTNPDEGDTNPVDNSPDNPSLAWYIGLHELSKNPYHQFSLKELAIVSGLGRTVISKIRQEPDAPFSGSKCSLSRLNEWLNGHLGFKQTGPTSTKTAGQRRTPVNAEEP